MKNLLKMKQKKVKVDEVIFEKNKCKVLTSTGAIYKNANAYFSSLPADLISLNLSTENKFCYLH